MPLSKRNLPYCLNISKKGAMNTGLTKKGVGVTKILTHFEFDFKLNGIFAIFTERNQNSIWFYFLNDDIWFVGLLEGSTGPLFLLGLLRARGHRDCPVWARSCLCPPLRHRPAPCQDLPHHQCGRLRGYDDVGRAYDSQRAEETLNNKMVSMFIFVSVAVFRHMLLQGFMRLQHDTAPVVIAPRSIMVLGPWFNMLH